MGKRPLLFKDADTGEIDCTSLEIKEEHVLTISDAAATFQRLAKGFLEGRNVAWAMFGDEWIVEPK